MVCCFLWIAKYHFTSRCPVLGISYWKIIISFKAIVVFPVDATPVRLTSFTNRQLCRPVYIEVLFFSRDIVFVYFSTRFLSYCILMIYYFPHLFDCGSIYMNIPCHFPPIYVTRLTNRDHWNTLYNPAID